MKKKHRNSSDLRRRNIETARLTDLGGGERGRGGEERGGEKGGGDSNPGSSALEANALTTRPTRRSVGMELKMFLNVICV